VSDRFSNAWGAAVLPDVKAAGPALGQDPADARAREPKRIYYLSMEFLIGRTLSNNVAAVIDADPAVQGRLKVLFLPDSCVSLAERLIPATIEMAREAGEDNFFLFGLTAQQVADSRGWYDPHWHFEHEPATRQALEQLRDDFFSRGEPGVFRPIVETLLERGDFYRHLADLTAYVEAQERVSRLYADRQEWARKAILNVAFSGQFSSDRTIQEYAAHIWKTEPCPVP
jgi:starch phosphorylase